MPGCPPLTRRRRCALSPTSPRKSGARSDSSRFNFQTATFNHARAIAPAHRAGCLSRMCPPIMRGSSAPEGAKGGVFASLNEKEARRLSARHQRRFWAKGALFRDRTGATRAPIRRLSPPSFPPPSSRERQSSVVSPDDDPRPPGSGEGRPFSRAQAPHPAPRYQASLATPLK